MIKLYSLRSILLIALVVAVLFAKGQTNHFNVYAGAGPSQFLNVSPDGQDDRVTMFGVSYSLNGRNQRFIFNPAVGYRANLYASYFTDHIHITTIQRCLSVDSDVLMKVHKYLFLNVGLLYTFVLNSDLSYWAHGENLTIILPETKELFNSYHPSLHQVGLNIGFAIPFKLFKRELRFHTRVSHYVTSVVDGDFRVTKSRGGPEVTVLANRARPTMLVFYAGSKNAKAGGEGF